MKVIECGTEVITRLESLRAIVTAINIRHKNVTYEISYFHQGEYKTAWVSESELKTENNNSLKIGFKTS